MEPGRATTCSGRNVPSLGASPPPASIMIVTRLTETVSGSGQLIGPACASGALEKSTRMSEPSISTTTSNGTGSSSSPLLSISPRPT